MITMMIDLLLHTNGIENTNNLDWLYREKQLYVGFRVIYCILDVLNLTYQSQSLERHEAGSDTIENMHE